MVRRRDGFLLDGWNGKESKHEIPLGDEQSFQHFHGGIDKSMCRRFWERKCLKYCRRQFPKKSRDKDEKRKSSGTFLPMFSIFF